MIPWNKGLKGKVVAWNKGLTKESDIRVAQYAKTLKKISKGKRLPIDYTSIKHRRMLSNRMQGNKNPSKRKEVKEKIQKTLLKTYKEHPEIKNKIRKTLLKTYKEHPEILETRKPSGLNQYSKYFSSIEKVIAKELNLRRIPFVHNWRTGKYFPDFIIFENVIIECDGKYWHKDEEKEQRRDHCLYKLGYFIFHLKETRITKNPKECIDMVEMVMKGLTWSLGTRMQGTTI